VPHILIAADAEWVIDDVRSALETPDTSFVVCRRGQDVAAAAKSRTPDLAVLDLQIGNMGGMAVCMNLRLDESGGRLPHIRVLMLLDRAADIFLARRAGAEGWLVKPLDSLRLSRAATAILNGGTVYEGMPRVAVVPTDGVAAGGLAAGGEVPTDADRPPAEEESARGDEVPAG
jgi:DNA-binding response OmpR family regulator